MTVSLPRSHPQFSSSHRSSKSESTAAKPRKSSSLPTAVDTALPAAEGSQLPIVSPPVVSHLSPDVQHTQGIVVGSYLGGLETLREFKTADKASFIADKVDVDNDKGIKSGKNAKKKKNAEHHDNKMASTSANGVKDPNVSAAEKKTSLTISAKNDTLPESEKVSDQTMKKHDLTAMLEGKVNRIASLLRSDILEHIGSERHINEADLLKIMNKHADKIAKILPHKSDLLNDDGTISETYVGPMLWMLEQRLSSSWIFTSKAARIGKEALHVASDIAGMFPLFGSIGAAVSLSADVAEVAKKTVNNEYGGVEIRHASRLNVFKSQQPQLKAPRISASKKDVLGDAVNVAMDTAEMIPGVGSAIAIPKLVWDVAGLVRAIGWNN